LYLGLDHLLDLVRLREAVCPQFGVCQLSIDGYLEPALSRGNEIQGLQQYEKYLAWRTERGDIEKLSGWLAGEPSIRYFDNAGV